MSALELTDEAELVIGMSETPERTRHRIVCHDVALGTYSGVPDFDTYRFIVQATTDTLVRCIDE